MSDCLLRMARRVVVWWVRVYTLGLPSEVRAARLEEIGSDLWYQIRWQRSAGREDVAIVLSITARWIRGAVDDVEWRREARPRSAARRRASATLLRWRSPGVTLVSAIRFALSPSFAFWSSMSVLAIVYILGVLIVSPLLRSLVEPLAYGYALALPLMTLVVIAGVRYVIRLMTSARNITWNKQMPPDLEALAERMNVRRLIKKYGEPDKLFNALADPFRGRVAVGKDLLARLSAEQVLAVLAHEFAHLRQMSRWTTALFGAYYTWVLLTAASLFAGWHPLIGVPPAVALNILLFCSLHWRMEFDADRNATNYVDPDVLADALEALEPDPIKRAIPSPMHPPINWRVARLRKLARERSKAMPG